MTEKVPKRKAGGDARAKSLSAEQRKEISKRAALTRWRHDVPKATHEGQLKLGGRIIECAVIEGGIRLLSEREVTKALGGKRGGSHWKRLKENPDGADLPVYLSATNLKPFISDELSLALRPVNYLPKSGGVFANGLRAETLPKVCNVFLMARDAGLRRRLRCGVSSYSLVKFVSKMSLLDRRLHQRRQHQRRRQYRQPLRR